MAAQYVLAEDGVTHVWPRHAGGSNEVKRELIYRTRGHGEGVVQQQNKSALTILRQPDKRIMQIMHKSVKKMQVHSNFIQSKWSKTCTCYDNIWRHVQRGEGWL